MPYTTDDIQHLEDLYDKAVQRGDEEIADNLMYITAELQKKILEHDTQNP